MVMDDDVVICANCLGEFLPEDMDGEHCRDCCEEIFGEPDDGQ